MVQQKKGSGESNGINKREYTTMSFQKKDTSDARVMGANPGKADVKQNGKLQELEKISRYLRVALTKRRLNNRLPEQLPH